MAAALDALLASVAGLPYCVLVTPLFEPSRSRIVFQPAGNTQENSAPSKPPWTPGPATLFVFDSNRNLTADMLKSKIGSWLQSDDVFNTNFLRDVYFLFPGEPEASKVSSVVESVLSSWGSSAAHIISLGPQDNATNWKAGPYFASPQGLRPAWRLFPDTQGAFVFPVVPSPDNPRRYVCRLYLGRQLPRHCKANYQLI